MGVERVFPVIPQVDRSQSAEFRTLRTMSYDNSDAVQSNTTAIKDLNSQLTNAFTGTIPPGSTITVKNGLITGYH